MIHWLFAIGSGFLMFLGLSLLFRRRMPIGVFLLGLYFIVEGYISYTTYLVYSGWIVDCPHFFRTGSPLMYLYGPLFYFFIVAVFNPQHRFRLFDLVHLLPFVLHTVELWPYWGLPGTEKTALYKEFLQTGPMYSNWGLLTFREHVIIKSGLVIGYSFAIFYKIRPAIGQLLANWKKQIIQSFLILDFFLRVGVFGMIFLFYLLFWLLPHGFMFLVDGIFFMDGFICAFFILLYPGFVSENFLGGERGTYVRLGSNYSGEGKSLETSKKVNASPPFEEKINSVFEEHYGDPGLSVATLSILMNMSERQLFRKAKEWTGKSPVELLLSFRLQKAHTAIQAQPEKSISQILHESGFKNQSYFSKRFREHFGLSPRDFRKSATMDKPENRPYQHYPAETYANKDKMVG